MTCSTLLIGLVLRALAEGLDGAIDGAVGVAVCLVVPAILYKASHGRGIGGGDLKLFAALGTLLGPTHGLEVELSSFVLVALFAMFRLAFVGQLLQLLWSSLRIVGALFVTSLRREQGLSPTAMTEVRMGPAIATAVVTVLALPQVVKWWPWLG